MRLVLDSSVIKCGHGGLVQNQASQKFVTVNQTPILIADDPVSRHIVACPNVGIGKKPCTNTLAVRAGYSSLVSISGHPVCLETLEGPTDGVDVEIVLYTVLTPGQSLVQAQQ